MTSSRNTRWTRAQLLRKHYFAPGTLKLYEQTCAQYIPYFTQYSFPAYLALLTGRGVYAREIITLDSAVIYCSVGASSSIAFSAGNAAHGFVVTLSFGFMAWGSVVPALRSAHCLYYSTLTGEDAEAAHREWFVKSYAALFGAWRVMGDAFWVCFT